MKNSLKTFIEDALFDKVDSFASYEKGFRVTTKIIPAPWSRVLYMAIINAFLILIARTVYVEIFGRSEMFAYHPALEAELQRELKELDSQN